MLSTITYPRDHVQYDYWPVKVTLAFFVESLFIPRDIVCLVAIDRDRKEVFNNSIVYLVWAFTPDNNEVRMMSSSSFQYRFQVKIRASLIQFGTWTTFEKLILNLDLKSRYEYLLREKTAIF